MDVYQGISDMGICAVTQMSAANNIHVIQTLHARILLVHTHANAIVALVEMGLCVWISTNAAQDNMDAIQMHHARILLVHTHVNAIVDLVEMELYARI